MSAAPQAPTFAQQRLIYLALLLGMSTYAILVAVLLAQNENKGMATERIPQLDLVVPIVGLAIASGAWLCRHFLSAAAGRLSGAARGQARFRATLIPLCMLEGGCLLGLTAWLLNGNPVPHLVTALVLLSLAIYVVPFSDPDASA